MRKEYIKMTRQVFNENMEAIGDVEERTRVCLIADTGKKIRSKKTGIMGTRVDVGSADSEENYEEVDDPNFVEVIQAIEAEVSGNV